MIRLLSKERIVQRAGKENDKAHPPIHPTNYATPSDLNQSKVYEFVVRRFLAGCAKDAIGSKTEVTVRIADEFFHAHGQSILYSFNYKIGEMILERNYLDVYPYDKWEGRVIPTFSAGMTFQPTILALRESKTTPPELLNEADLIDLMNKKGIGTDATIHDHIKKVLDREYVFRENGKFIPSNLGFGLVQGYDQIALEMSLTKPKLRGDLEVDLERICRGELTKAEVLSHHLQMYERVYKYIENRVFELDGALRRYLRPPSLQ